MRRACAASARIENRHRMAHKRIGMLAKNKQSVLTVSYGIVEIIDSVIILHIIMLSLSILYLSPCHCDCCDVCHMNLSLAAK